MTRIYSTAIAQIGAGTTVAAATNVVLSNANGVSFGANGATITASVAAATQSTAPGAFAAGTVTITSGTVILSNGGGVSFGAQLSGTLLGILVAVTGASLVYGTLKATLGLRLDPEEEFNGADLSIHKIGATPDREANW